MNMAYGLNHIKGLVVQSINQITTTGILRRGIIFGLLFSALSFSIDAQDTIITLEKGLVHRYKEFQSKYVASRNIDVWLPTSYSEKNCYDVIYFHDGQNLFDTSIVQSFTGMEWNVDETASVLMDKELIRNVIVVGIWNTSKRRPEYFPQKAYELLDTITAAKVSADIKGKPESDNYLKFIVDELKPHIDSKYTTKKSRNHTWTAGSSMGGLISLYAVCEYPQVFGGAACFSTHWVGCPKYRSESVSEAFIKYLAENLPSAKTHRFYFDHGTKGLDGEYAKWQQRANEVFSKGKYTENQLKFELFEFGEHTEASWSQHLDDGLLFILKK